MEPELSPLRDAEWRLPRKSKKRKHVDPEQGASSKKKKKRKHLEASLENAPDTPTQPSRSRLESPPLNNISQSPPSSPLHPETVADSDHDISLINAPAITNGTPPPTSSPFYTTTLSLYLPLPAIALSPTTALPSLLTTHLTPLLLTYYPPLRGIVLSISNPFLSSRKPQSDKPPPPPADPAARTVLAHCADTDGLSYIWLTATFLTFQPQIGDELEGWVNVCSEGFVGLVCYNYFQVAVARDRIPGQWRWVPPGGEAGNAGKGKTGKRKGEKGKRKGEKGKRNHNEEGGATSQETLLDGNGDGEIGDENKEEGEEQDRESGYFRREDGTRVKGAIRFRVVDSEIVPGHDRESWSLQIEGTLLSVDDEKRVLEEERQRDLRRQGIAVMSGGIGSRSRNGSLSHSRRETPT